MSQCDTVHACSVFMFLLLAHFRSLSFLVYGIWCMEPLNEAKDSRMIEVSLAEMHSASVCVISAVNTLGRWQ